jgi:hypothetical protein
MKRKKVLIIDDAIDFSFLMKEYFSKKDCDVFAANFIAIGMVLVRQ